MLENDETNEPAMFVKILLNKIKMYLLQKEHIEIREK